MENHMSGRRGGSRGKHNAESRRKMSESHIGQIPANAWKKGNLPWNTGKIWSDDVKKKMSQAKLGVARSESARKAVSDGMKRAKLGPSRVDKKRGSYKKTLLKQEEQKGV